MDVDKEKFFREVTLKICSSLDINTALERVLEYLQQYLPFTQIFLYVITDINLGTSCHLAMATDGTVTDKKLVTPAKEHWAWARQQRKAFILRASDTGNNIQKVATMVELKGKSILVLPLRIEDETIGFLVLRTQGEDKFTCDHAELMNLVAMPFAIALSNAKAHKAIVKDRDLLIDTNHFLNKEMMQEEIIGANLGLRNVMEMVQRVAPQKTTVLLNGETGTGKEVIANAIHFASKRKNGPFIKLNCGAISENLIDDELFGHEKGAFTGATTKKRGRFERANGGTLFLDEIGELPLQNQVRLLRVLQSQKICRVGGEKAIPVDVRIIAATNRDLKSMVAENRFREDLWFRLNVFPIMVPPLRERKTDIFDLIRYFLTQKSQEMGIAISPNISSDAFGRLMSYDWPGNVRELENLVERELIWHRGGQLEFHSMSSEKACSQIVPAPEGIFNYPLNLDEAMSLHISRVLEMTKGKIHGPTGAGYLLGINPNTLRARMDKFGIKYKREKGGNTTHYNKENNN